MLTMWRFFSPLQLVLAHPISSHAPAVSASPFPGRVIWMTTAATGQMSPPPAVGQLCPSEVWRGKGFFFMRFHCVTEHWCCLSTAYPTCFPLTQFTCSNGRCINVNWRCDNGSCLLWSSTRSLLLIIVQISPRPSLPSFYPLCMFVALLPFWLPLCVFSLTSWLLLLCVVSFALCCRFCSVLCRLPIPLSLVGSVLQKRIVGTALMSWIVQTWPVSA